MDPTASHMTYAIGVSNHISDCFAQIQDTVDRMGVDISVDGSPVNFLALRELWEKVNLKMATTKPETFKSMGPPIMTILSTLGAAMNECYAGYEIAGTFAFYEMCFELCVNIFVLLQNLRDAPNRPSEVVAASKELVKTVSDHMVTVLESINDVYDEVMAAIPKEEADEPGVSGNLRLYMFEIIVEIFGAENVRGRDLMDLLSNDVASCVSLLAVVIGHNGAPFRVQQAAAKALLELTFPQSVFLTGAADSRSRKVLSIDAAAGNADLNSQSMKDMSKILQHHVNHTIASLIHQDVIAAFTRCICLHQNNHWRTDVLVRHLMATLHNCLLYCSQFQTKLKRYITDSGIITNILIPYVDNVIPALENICVAAVEHAKATPAPVATETGAAPAPVLVRAGREVSSTLEWQNMRSTVQSLVATADLLGRHICESGIIARFLLNDALLPAYTGDLSLLEAVAKMCANSKFADVLPKEVVKQVTQALHKIRVSANDRDALRLRERLLGRVSATAAQAQPVTYASDATVLALTPLLYPVNLIDSTLQRSAAEVGAEVRALVKDGRLAVASSTVCPLSGLALSDPVQTPQGIVYDRKSIREFLQTHAECPVTGQPLRAADLQEVSKADKETTQAAQTKQMVTGVAAAQGKASSDALPIATTTVQPATAAVTKEESEVALPKTSAKPVSQPAVEKDSAPEDVEALKIDRKEFSDAPDEFCCHMDGRIMTFPMRSPNGDVFEKSVIERWFSNCGQVCPVTSEPLLRSELVVDTKLRARIEAWVNSRK